VEPYPSPDPLTSPFESKMALPQGSRSPFNSWSIQRFQLCRFLDLQTLSHPLSNQGLR
jgi:hypothetical protein